MGVEFWMRREFVVVCDRCDNQASAALSSAAAKTVAREEGWVVKERHNGLALVRTWLCPGCAENDPIRVGGGEAGGENENECTQKAFLV